MTTNILNEFVEADVMTISQANELQKIVAPIVAPDDYVDRFSLIVTMMLKHKMYTPRESTMTRQALRDLFDSNQTEYKKLVAGEPKLVGFFIGRAIATLGKNYNPKDIQARIMEMVEEEKQTYYWETL